MSSCKATNAKRGRHATASAAALLRLRVHQLELRVLTLEEDLAGALERLGELESKEVRP